MMGSRMCLRAEHQAGRRRVDFVAVVDQVITLLRQRRRVAYRTLKVQFHLDDDALEALKDELLYAHQIARDEDGRMLVWTGDALRRPFPSAPRRVRRLPRLFRQRLSVPDGITLCS